MRGGKFNKTRKFTGGAILHLNIEFGNYICEFFSVLKTFFSLKSSTLVEKTRGLLHNDVIKLGTGVHFVTPCVPKIVTIKSE